MYEGRNPSSKHVYGAKVRDFPSHQIKSRLLSSMSVVVNHTIAVMLWRRMICNIFELLPDDLAKYCVFLLSSAI